MHICKICYTFFPVAIIAWVNGPVTNFSYIWFLLPQLKLFELNQLKHNEIFLGKTIVHLVWKVYAINKHKLQRTQKAWSIKKTERWAPPNHCEKTSPINTQPPVA